MPARKGIMYKDGLSKPMAFWICRFAGVAWRMEPNRKLGLKSPANHPWTKENRGASGNCPLILGPLSLGTRTATFRVRHATYPLYSGINYTPCKLTWKPGTETVGLYFWLGLVLGAVGNSSPIRWGDLF